MQATSTAEDAIQPATLTGADAAGISGGKEAALPAAPPWLAGGLAAAGMAILIFTLLRTVRRRAARRQQPVEPPARLASIRSDAHQRDQLANLMVDVEELTRRFAAQLDNKAARLEILLTEADEAIQRLERAAPGRARAAAAADLDDDADPVTREVYRLADEGCSAMEIARRLEQHTGKVELILALRHV